MPHCPACGVEVDEASDAVTCPACGVALLEAAPQAPPTSQPPAAPRNQWLVDQPGIEPYHYLTSTGRLRSGRTPPPRPPRPPADDPETGDDLPAADGPAATSGTD